MAWYDFAVTVQYERDDPEVHEENMKKRDEEDSWFT